MAPGAGFTVSKSAWTKILEVVRLLEDPDLLPEA